MSFAVEKKISKKFKRAIVDRDEPRRIVKVRYRYEFKLECGHTHVVYSTSRDLYNRFAYCFKCYWKAARGEELP